MKVNILLGIFVWFLGVGVALAQNEEKKPTPVHHFEFGQDTVEVDVGDLEEEGKSLPISSMDSQSKVPSPYIFEIGGKRYLLLPKEERDDLGVFDGDTLYKLEESYLSEAVFKSMLEQYNAFKKLVHSLSEELTKAEEDLRKELKGDTKGEASKEDQRKKARDGLLGDEPKANPATKTMSPEEIEQEVAKRLGPKVEEAKKKIETANEALYSYAIEGGSFIVGPKKEVLIKNYEGLLKDPMAKGKAVLLTKELIQEDQKKMMMDLAKKMEEGMKYSPLLNQMAYHVQKGINERAKLLHSVIVVSTNAAGGLETNQFNFSDFTIRRADGKVEQLKQQEAPKEPIDNFKK